MSAVLERVDQVSASIESHAVKSDADRRLAPEVVDALVDIDAMRMFVPGVYNGPELDPLEMLEVVEALARIDGPAGWCSMIASTTSLMSSFLPTPAAETIYADRHAVTGGVFAPNGAGAVDGDEVTVTGRWAWGSGTQHCDWVAGGVLCDDDSFRLCFFPGDDLTFHDTWHTGGMRGSGSLDYSVDGAVVPLGFTLRPGVDAPVTDAAIARCPTFTVLAASVAAVGLGIARRSVDELVALAQNKHPQFSSKSLAKSAFTQIEIARAEANLRAARSLLFDEMSTVWDAVRSTGDASVEQRLGVRLAATHAAMAAASVVDTAYTLAGGTAVYDTSPLGRCLRDVHVVTQHIQTAPKLNETLGRVLLGVDADTSML